MNNYETRALDIPLEDFDQTTKSDLSSADREIEKAQDWIDSLTTRRDALVANRNAYVSRVRDLYAQAAIDAADAASQTLLQRKLQELETRVQEALSVDTAWYDKYIANFEADKAEEEVRKVSIRQRGKARIIRRGMVSEQQEFDSKIRDAWVPLNDHLQADRELVDRRMWADVGIHPDADSNERGKALNAVSADFVFPEADEDRHTEIQSEFNANLNTITQTLASELSEWRESEQRPVETRITGDRYGELVKGSFETAENALTVLLESIAELQVSASAVPLTAEELAALPMTYVA